jgi:hypothetical protein
VIHLVSMLTDRGISAENAALASSALGVALLLGRVGSGYVLDRVAGLKSFGRSLGTKLFKRAGFSVEQGRPKFDLRLLANSA